MTSAAASWLRPDLVQECQRASVALQDVTQEPAHEPLHLGLDVGRQSQPGDGLDVQAAIRAQQLERPERQRR